LMTLLIIDGHYAIDAIIIDTCQIHYYYWLLPLLLRHYYYWCFISLIPHYWDIIILIIIFIIDD
jgi:hypothetical protein